MTIFKGTDIHQTICDFVIIFVACFWVVYLDHGGNGIAFKSSWPNHL